MNIICTVGIIAFAVSGATAAIEKHTDPFGTIIAAVLTACGGGITRDILLGITPPRSLLDPSYISLASATALIVYLIAFILKDAFRSGADVTDTAVNVFDALGLGVFVVMGTQTAIDCGFSQNAFLSILIGVLTGCGGGFLRDITLREIPVMLKRHVYVIAACCGGAVFYIMYTSQFGYTLSVTASVLVTFSLRMLATRYKWNLPPAY